MAPTGNLTQSKLIAAPPALISTADAEVAAYLAGLPAPDFDTTADWKTEWAVAAASPEGTEFDSSSTAWVVSAESYRRIRARRYS